MSSERCGIIALLHFRVAVIVGCVFSVAAAMATVAGIVVDAMSYNLTYTLDRCNNRYSGGIYDSLQYVDDAAVGAPYNSQEWVCVHGADASTCYLFRSQRARNCGSILTALPALLLLASMTLQILLFFMVLHYSLLTCMTLREDSQDGSAPPPHSVSVPDAHSGSTAPPPVVSTALAVPTEQTNVV